MGVAAGLGHLWLSAVATVIGWIVLGPLRRLERRHPGGAFRLEAERRRLSKEPGELRFGLGVKGGGRP